MNTYSPFRQASRFQHIRDIFDQHRKGGTVFADQRIQHTLPIAARIPTVPTTVMPTTVMTTTVMSTTVVIIVTVLTAIVVRFVCFCCCVVVNVVVQMMVAAVVFFVVGSHDCFLICIHVQIRRDAPVGKTSIATNIEIWNMFGICLEYVWNMFKGFRKKFRM